MSMWRSCPELGPMRERLARKGCWSVHFSCKAKLLIFRTNAMKFLRRAARNGSLRPRAENHIRGIPSEHLHHLAHQLKHPLSTYQTSLSRIETAWHKVLPLLDKLYVEVMCNVQLTQYEPMLESYEALLYRLNEHIDATHEIMRSLRAPIAGKENRPHVEFLRATKLPGFRTFHETIHGGYRDQHLGVMVNEMKHASAQLRAVSGRTENRVIVGFFVDGPHPNGAIGPNKKVSEALCHCIDSTLQADHGIVVQEQLPNIAPEKWAQLCLACSQITPAFFFDECAKPYPIVICPPDMASVELQFPTQRRPLGHKSLEISMLITLSEQNRSFVMPYFQQQPFS
jgi:hypothetical protein